MSEQTGDMHKILFGLEGTVVLITNVKYYYLQFDKQNKFNLLEKPGAGAIITAGVDGIGFLGSVCDFTSVYSGMGVIGQKSLWECVGMNVFINRLDWSRLPSPVGRTGQESL